MPSGKLILVIGAPGHDGAASPYLVRVLTRDPSSKRAKELAARGVECVKGSFDDLAAVAAAFEGAWVNTDSFTVGEQKEIYLGIKIFEIAKRARSVRHYVWSNLDYVTKKADYDPLYQVDHYNAKGTVAEFLKAQSSIVSDFTLSWTAVSTGPYMDMLKIISLSSQKPFFGPLNKRADGTFVFATPVGDGYIPMIALGDLGFWARWTFDHRSGTSAKDLEIASELIQVSSLVEKFSAVTGKPAVYKRLTIDQCHSVMGRRRARTCRQRADFGETESSNATWSGTRRSTRTNNYTGEMELDLLKNFEDGKAGFAPDPSKTVLL
ncbi:NAD(P)-binding protein [Mycena latifolia]|nr:NAD(P)-binding protein [Mycena latifolia]